MYCVEKYTIIFYFLIIAIMQAGSKFSAVDTFKAFQKLRHLKQVTSKIWSDADIDVLVYVGAEIMIFIYLFLLFFFFFFFFFNIFIDDH